MTDRPARRRRRDEELLGGIRQAVRDELRDHGYPGVTFEGVARRAGTSKPVLYRRFDSRAEMVLATLLTFENEPLPAIRSETLVDGLVELMEMLLHRPGPDGLRTFLALTSELDDDRVASVTTFVFGIVTGRLDELIETARTRGELGTEPVPPRVLSAIVSLIRGELLFAHSVRRPADLRGLAEQVIVPLLRISTGCRGT